MQKKWAGNKILLTPAAFYSELTQLHWARAGCFLKHHLFHFKRTKSRSLFVIAAVLSGSRGKARRVRSALISHSVKSRVKPVSTRFVVALLQKSYWNHIIALAVLYTFVFKNV